MVDLTILSKKELIVEFDLILSEWQQCKQKINSFEAEISELKRRDNDITSDIRENMKFVKRQKKIDKKIKKVEKIYKFSNAIYNFLHESVILLLIIVIFISIIGFIFSDGNFIPLILFLIIIFCCRFSKFEKMFEKMLDYIFYPFEILFDFLTGRRFVIKKLKKFRSQEKELYDELNLLIEQNKEHKEIEVKIESLPQKIQQIKIDFQEFRCKRNNLSAKYHGYEHLLKSYLENGTADNFKEALLRLEENIHRDKMLSVQENMRMQMNNMRNQLSSQSRQLSHQSAQLAGQSAQIDNLQREIDYLS